MNKKDYSKRILLSLTGETDRDWKSKIDEINDLNINTIALFLSRFTSKQRSQIYTVLEESTIRKIPLIHIRNDMDANELKYLCEKYNDPWLTIHEGSFKYLDKWKEYLHLLCLEMNYDSSIAKNVDVDKIGGFCIDLSHFKSAEEKWSKEFEYILEKRKDKGIFKCNHLNGYSYSKNRDMHIISNFEEFEYLKTLPSFVFSDTIAIEVFNSIRDQIMYKKHIINLLNGVY